jgi:hypothetical protein
MTVGEAVEKAVGPRGCVRKPRRRCWVGIGGFVSSSLAEIGLRTVQQRRPMDGAVD